MATDALDPRVSISQIELVLACYRNILGREPIDGEIEAWRSRSKKLSADTILQTFLLADEFKFGYGTVLENHFQEDLPLFNAKSQFGEVGFVLEDYLRSSDIEPFVVDVGANGKQRSNSYDLMKTLGWRGLLIEPNKALTDAIRRDFQGCKFDIEECAISDFTGKAEFTLGINSDVSSLNASKAATWGTTQGTVTVRVERLFELLEKYEVPRNFGLLSVDVEGEDNKVVNDLLDNSDFRPSYLIIEVGMPVSDAGELVELGFTSKLSSEYSVVTCTKANVILRFSQA